MLQSTEQWILLYRSMYGSRWKVRLTLGEQTLCADSVVALRGRPHQVLAQAARLVADTDAALHATRDWKKLAPAASWIFRVRRLAPDGLEAWTQVVERGYEGYVAKDEASAYEGGATRRWLKVKHRDWRSGRIGGGGGSARLNRLADSGPPALEWPARRPP